MDQDRILTNFRFNGTPRIWLALLGNSYIVFYYYKNESIRKNILPYTI